MMNRTLLERSIASLSSLVSYAKWQLSEGGNAHPTLPSALATAENVLEDAKGAGDKSSVSVVIEGQEYEISGCPFCGSTPVFNRRAGDAFGFLCTCGGKRYVQTYYDTSIKDREGRIQSAVASWNDRPNVGKTDQGGT